jgi:glucokinase
MTFEFISGCIKMANEKMILAGDIGGTKTVLAIYAEDRTRQTPLKKARFASRDYPSLGAIVAEFFADGRPDLARASFGVAGPVQLGVAHITNLPWVVDAVELSKQIQVPVRLLNDLTAIAHAIPFLSPADLETLNPGVPVKKGVLGVIAPGTGLGEAFLTWVGNRYHPHASEGGHSGFSPANELQVELIQFLQSRFGHVSFERVCSGSGLPNLYAFLKESGRYPEPGWLREALALAADSTPVIVQTGMENRSAICVATLDLFADIIGNEAGNLALKVLATGGIYLAGGMPGRILPWLRKPDFIQAFTQKGRFTEMLNNVPVHVVLNPETALIGAANHGFEAENFYD